MRGLLVAVDPQEALCMAVIFHLLINVKKNRGLTVGKLRPGCSLIAGNMFGVRFRNDSCMAWSINFLKIGSVVG